MPQDRKKSDEIAETMKEIASAIKQPTPLVLPPPPKNDLVDATLNLVELQIRNQSTEKQNSICKFLTELAFKNFDVI